MNAPQKAGLESLPTLDEARLLERSMSRALAWLGREQQGDGHWVGMLECNYLMEAEWLMAMHVLGYEHPRKADLAATLLAAQRPDGA